MKWGSTTLPLPHDVVDEKQKEREMPNDGGRLHSMMTLTAIPENEVSREVFQV